MKPTSTSATSGKESMMELNKYHLGLLYQLCSRLNFFISAYTALAGSLIPYLFSTVILSHQQPRFHPHDASLDTPSTNCNSNGIGYGNGDTHQTIFDTVNKESIPWTAWLIPAIFIFMPTILLRSWSKRARKSTSTTSASTRCPYEKLRIMFLCPTGQNQIICQENTTTTTTTTTTTNTEMKPIVSVSIPPSPSPCHNSNQQRSIRSIRSKTVLNPKRVITTSLCLWIFLVLSAPKLGLKNSLLFKVNSSGGLDAPNSIFSSPGSIGSAQMLTCLSGYNSNKVTDPDMVDPDVDMGLDVEGEYPDVFMPTVINDQELEKLVQDAEEDLVMDSEWMGGDDDDDDDEIVVDGEEGEEEEREYSGVPEPFDYDSFSLLEEEEESAQDDVIGLMNCNKYLGGQQQGNGGQERLEHSFEYVPYWTHAMIILISLPIGGMIAGRNLMHSQAQEMISELESKLNKNGTVYSYIRNTVPFKMIIMGNLGFFFSFGWIILYGHNEHFDLYFASIGLGLMVLTQKWIPEDLETMLETNSVRRSSYEVEADIVVDLEKDTKEFQV